MMKNLIKKRIALFFPLFLVIICGILVWRNFTPGTWLSGWDTLHPEFNFSLNFQRILSVWHEEQGLGTLTGHSQAAELPRIIFLWLCSLVFPASFLRYFYFIVCLILGPLGVYFFIEKIVFPEEKNSEGRIFSFLGGLFYLLNLGTVQHFFVPFEMFAALYALLPWILLSATFFVKNGRKKTLLSFCFLSFLSASMAYAATLWYAFFVFFSFYILMTFLVENRRKAHFKRVLLLFLTILSINSFWLFPTLYHLSSSAKEVTVAKINQIFSERAFSTDEKYATPKNAFLLKGFLFDWQKYNKGEFAPLLGEWNNHINKPIIKGTGWVIVVITLVGVFTSFLPKKKKPGIVLLPGLIFSFIFLIYGMPVLRDIFSVLRERSDIFKEGLRFPWTKFSIFVIFSFAVYFSLGVEKIAGLWRKSEMKILAIFCLPFFTALIIVWTLPAFKGKLISPFMRIKIPQDYFDMFSYFKNKPKDERIALFPASSFLGWEYYKWGFEGAGFIWFGLPQPVLTRDFDRWHPANENFYWEISYAIYAKNSEQFMSVLQKYKVKWLLFDESKIDPAWPMATPSTIELRNLISGTGEISLERTFGKIKIYKVNLKTPVKDFVWMAEYLPVINSYDWGNLDGAYNEMGNYVSPSNGKLIADSEELELKTQNSSPKYLIQNTKYNIYYPFRSLFTGKKTNELDVEIEDLGDRFVFRKKLPESVKNYQLLVPAYDGNELIEVDKNDLAKVKHFIPSVSVIGDSVEVVVPKIKGLLSAEIEPAEVEEALQAKNCNQFFGGEVISNSKLVIREKGTTEEILRLEAIDANNCSASFWLPDLSHKYAYLISAETKNVSGRPLLFWLENLTNRKADMELYLLQNSDLKTQSQNFKPKNEKKDNYVEYLIQPPMAGDGLGYTLHFDNISIGRQKTINELGKISIHPIPYKFLTSLKLIEPKYFNDIYRLSENAGGVNVFNLEGSIGSNLRNSDTEKIAGVDATEGVYLTHPLGVSASHLRVEHPNPAVYEIDIDSKIPNDAILVLSQAYHEGWKAYKIFNFQAPVFNKFPIFKFLEQNLPFLFGEELEHMKVNNWENGWRYNVQFSGSNFQGRTVILIFWPQYLEYVGFVLLAVGLITVFLINKESFSEVKSKAKNG